LHCQYHDEEWGVPVHDDGVLFEYVVLEGAQAGLSWSTILKKRDAYRRAFSGFDPVKVARYSSAKEARLLQDSGIVRNRQKIASAVTNAKAFLRLQEEEGSFDRWLWSHVKNRPVRGRWRTWKDIPASTPLSETISRDLKRRGFKFIGPTICYAFLQAVGVVDDHETACFRSRRRRASSANGR
jgi:DNA-3-methyladenine glycosylase I